MIIRARAPLRIGLAGGGTDVSPYSDLYGGAILNATISIFAHTSIVPNSGNHVRIESLDLNEEKLYKKAKWLPIDGQLDLIKGCHNHIFKGFK